jgi:hypothetical protein
MTPMRIFAIGIGVGLGLVAILCGTANALGAPEDIHGLLFLACSAVGSLTGAMLVIREQDRTDARR